MVVSSHDGQARKVGVAAVFNFDRFHVHDVGEKPLTLPTTANKLNIVDGELVDGVNRMEL